MKKTLLSIAVMAFIFSSCNNSKKEEHTTKQELEVVSYENHDAHHADAVLNNDWMQDMKIDNGTKWFANKETNEGVQKMQNSIKTQTTTQLEEYHKLAETLNVEKNYVIKNCTMEGASHDNLHIWLLPLMAKIDALAETKSVDEASKIKQHLAVNINAYYNYFQ